MDGVVVDSESHNLAHLKLFVTGLGIAETDIDWAELAARGASSRKVWTHVIEKYGLEHDVDDLIKQGRQSYIKYLESLDRLDEIPGVTELIKHLHKQGYKLALGSSANPIRVELFLNKLGLKKYFSAVVSGDDVPRTKPAPDVFLLAAKKLGVKPSDCIVIEDAHLGVRAAKAAGMKCIAYAGSEENLDDLTQADVIIKDFKTLVRSMQKGTLPV